MRTTRPTQAESQRALFFGTDGTRMKHGLGHRDWIPVRVPSVLTPWQKKLVSARPSCGETNELMTQLLGVELRQLFGDQFLLDGLAGESCSDSLIAFGGASDVDAEEGGLSRSQLRQIVEED